MKGGTSRKKALTNAITSPRYGNIDTETISSRIGEHLEPIDLERKSTPRQNGSSK